ncbi:MAG: selenocysteine-specific translation elongation factor [Bacteroidia bacterium]|nr:selenocysteine-specific translation elongation factor [Bacteroidia bacterium]
MKHLTIGTAGHVDHGKTALIKALTNVDCDTHKEEKLRGITINLGFTHFILPSSEKVGIVDVPGHKDFIHTMISGASGMDLVLLVIAADSGVMPQTIEHLNILEILGIKKGLVVLTKTDLVDEDLILLAIDEIKDFLKNTFFEFAPVIRVSSITGAGIDKLKDMIAKVAGETHERKKSGFFRMYIDRIFNVKGFGSVVTGTVINGKLDLAKQVFLLPGDKTKELKVRRIEKYGTATDTVEAGDRAAINLAGLEKNDFIRGMIISDTNLKATTIFDAKLSLFKNSRQLNLWSDVIFLCGTYESHARLHLLNKNEINGGENAIVQIHLDKPCILIYSDRFIIRNTSGTRTLGGGEIIDPFPLHHKRRSPELLENISKLAEGSITELIRTEVKKYLVPVTDRQIAETLNIPANEIYNICMESSFDDIVKYSCEQLVILIVHQRDMRYYEKTTIIL